MTAPIVQTHAGIWVVRDDLHPGGTKARFIGRVFDGVQEAVYPRAFGQVAILGAPFPADRHYDAKAWELCVAMRGPGRVLFWNVAPLPCR